MHNVLILGAGMAGLTCARRLAEAGLRVCVVEANDRSGGRIRTDRVDGQIVELGAEFVHGNPPELLALIREAGLTLNERGGSQVSFTGDALTAEDDDRDAMFAPLEQLKHLRGPDLSFAQFLAATAPDLPSEQREAALGYIEGFNASDAHEISARALGIQQTAEDLIDGDAVAHIGEGYQRLPDFLAAEILRLGGEIAYRTPVTAIRWSIGRVAFETPAGEFVAPCAVITLPLGVLQARAVPILPEPNAILQAAATMRMGEVCRFTLVFRSRFWQHLAPQPAMRELSFLFSFGEQPPVWWTAHPEQVCTLTGWVGGPRAASLLRLSQAELAAHAVAELSRLFSLPASRIRSDLVACRTHNWSADPFSRGAYSYVAVGGTDASEHMSRPVEHTLFFSGEHTDTTGHWGTVHGAMRSGLRAAAQVLDAAAGVPNLATKLK